MRLSTIIKTVKNIIASRKGIDIDRIDIGDSLESLDIDIIDMYKIMESVDDTFDICISIDKTNRIKYVDDMVVLVLGAIPNFDVDGKKIYTPGSNEKFTITVKGKLE